MLLKARDSEHRGLKMTLPKPGQRIVFEAGDASGIERRTELQLTEIRPHGYGEMYVAGWDVQAPSLNTPTVHVIVPVATVEARFVHRRGTQ